MRLLNGKVTKIYFHGTGHEVSIAHGVLEKLCTQCCKIRSIHHYYSKGAQLHNKCISCCHHKKARRSYVKFAGSDTKQCSCCKQIKNLDQFHRRGNRASGFMSSCIECVKTKKQGARVYIQTVTGSTLRVKHKKYQYNYRDYIDDESIAEKSAQRKAIKLQAMPPWAQTVEIKRAINQIYKKARLLSEETGEIYHVDHIVPLKGKNSKGEHVVSGLHVPWNLTPIPKKENLSKYCKF